MRLANRHTVRPARVAALAFTLLAAIASLTGCRSSFAGLTLTIAAGDDSGVYRAISERLAGIWGNDLGIARPTLQRTNGSLDDIRMLRDGTADIGFSSADVIGDVNAGPHRLRALARVYDDYIQIVVRHGGPIRKLSDLAGRRVSLGAVGSQVAVVANRILNAAGVHTEIQSALGIGDSIKALGAGQIDAFFWSGGLPTPTIKALDGSVPIDLLDLGTDPSDVLAKMREKYSVYGTAVIPAGAYRTDSPAVTTLVVPNFLLVTDAMPDNVAQALVSSFFDAVPQLVTVIPAAEAIDLHTAIFTEPVPLHPGAEAYYRSIKI
jgi:hypothetical protein